MILFFNPFIYFSLEVEIRVCANKKIDSLYYRPKQINISKILRKKGKAVPKRSSSSAGGGSDGSGGDGGDGE